MRDLREIFEWGRDPAAGGRAGVLLALAAANGVLVSGITKKRFGAEQRSVGELQHSKSVGASIDRLLPWTGRDARLLVVTLAGLLRVPRLALVGIARPSNLLLIRRLAAACAMLQAPAD